MVWGEEEGIMDGIKTDIHVPMIRSIWIRQLFIKTRGRDDFRVMWLGVQKVSINL